MALNKSKTRKIFMTYMMVMQFIVTIIGMAIFGYFIGNKIDETSNLSLILTAVGLALGVIIGFMTLLQLMRSEDRYERRTRH
ncbi:MAG: AtpZ/AtpI family protein [Bacillota bacterium]|nr:MAG: AtpZ/AtpI family protein [Bacillota bacterium]